jgi:hypothetical protein
MSVSVDCTRRESGRKAPPPPGRKPYSSLPDPLRDDPTIPPAAKSLLLILAGFAWGARPACWPSDRTLGARLGRSIPTVRRWLAWLAGRGLIARYPADNATGREIALPWKLGIGAGRPSVENERPPVRNRADPRSNSD